jgi:hypothetical protein
LLLSLLWGALGGEPVAPEVEQIRNILEVVRAEATKTTSALAAANMMHAIGLELVSTRSATHRSGEDWRDFLSNAKQYVWLSGTGQFGWLRDTEFFRECVRRGLASGCQYRIALYAPSLPVFEGVLDELVATERDKAWSTISHNRDALRFYKDVEISQVDVGPGTFELRVIDNKIQYSMMSRFDDVLIVTPYMYHVRSENSPAFEYRGTSAAMFQLYCREFASLWDYVARPLSDDEIAFLTDE